MCILIILLEYEYIKKLDSATSKLETLQKYFVERSGKVEVNTKEKKLLKG